MSNFDERALAHLEKLCRIRCTEKEEKELLLSLGKIIDYIRQLDEVDTKEVSACNYVLKEMASAVLRSDSIGETMSREQFLLNAPDQIGGMIRVPPVIKMP